MGEVSTCGVVDLEVLYSADSPATYRAAAAALADLPRAPIDTGCVERAGLTVLHYDSEFERIAGVTGQPTQWVVPRGGVS
jgi:predicted nucleic acid-binding protein